MAGSKAGLFYFKHECVLKYEFSIGGGEGSLSGSVVDVVGLCLLHLFFTFVCTFREYSLISLLINCSVILCKTPNYLLTVIFMHRTCSSKQLLNDVLASTWGNADQAEHALTVYSDMTNAFRQEMRLLKGLTQYMMTDMSLLFFSE